MVRAANKEELDLVERGGPAGDSMWYFKTPRPPLLRDFFDERLHRTFSFRRSNHEVPIELKFERSRLAAL